MVLISGFPLYNYPVTFLNIFPNFFCIREINLDIRFETKILKSYFFGFFSTFFFIYEPNTNMIFKALKAEVSLGAFETGECRKSVHRHMGGGVPFYSMNCLFWLSEAL